MRISTDGKDEATRTQQSGALSSRQKIALIQQGKWWPFDRVEGQILVKLHKQHLKQNQEPVEEAPL